MRACPFRVGTEATRVSHAIREFVRKGDGKYIVRGGLVVPPPVLPNWRSQS